MTDKIMELARNFRYADLRQVESTRRALEAAIKAEQDYTRAVIGERDAWKESADEQVALLMKTANERDRLRKELDK